MRGTTEPPITAGQMKWLSDEKLEKELKIAALNTRRPARFALLLDERERRHDLRRPRPRRRLLLRREKAQSRVEPLG